MKKVIIIHDVYDKSKREEADTDDVLAYLAQEFSVFPDNARIYHMSIAKHNDVTPTDEKSIKKLAELNGTFYVVIYPAWLQILYYAVVALMAAFSVYSILTMPKPPNQTAGSSNNELSQRSNRARINGRVPDIYGCVRAYSDLIAEIYTVYIKGIEVEECLMVVGRGYYQILDMRDGDTDVANIPGTSVSVYDPFTRIDGHAIYQVGEKFDYLPKYVKKSGSINGQTIEQPNTSIIETSDVWFESPNLIKSNSVKFSELFIKDDRIALSGAVFGVADIQLSGQITVKGNSTVVIQSLVDIADQNDFKGLLLSAALVEVETVVRKNIIGDDGETSVVEETIKTTRDVSGQYFVTGISKSIVTNGFHFEYVISLLNPSTVNPNWSYINGSYSIAAAVKLNKNTNSISLDSTYTINSVNAGTIALVDPAAINGDWNKIQALSNQNTAGQEATVRFDTVSSKYVGWFNLDMTDAEQLIVNVFFPSGLFYQDSKGGVWNEQITVVVEVQQINEDGKPIGVISSFPHFIDRRNKSQFGETLYMNLTKQGSIRFRVSRTTATQNGKSQDTCKVKAVYASATLDIADYGYVTVLRSRTVATDGALSAKEREQNCLLNRKLRINGAGEYVVTRCAGQALIDAALDEYIGRRTAAEIDIAQITAEIEKINQYFGSSVMSEFNYTIDDENLSFEEIARMIASAAFCEPYRFGNVTRLKFEAPQENSVLLFNHRNKVPGTEKRTYSFGVQKDYDGIELEYTSNVDDKRVKYQIPENGSAKNPLKITTTGIRNEAQAKTRAWREWNKLKYKYVVCEFDALDESELLIRNDRILIADNTLVETQDGEIRAVDGLTLRTSRALILDRHSTYYIYLQMQDSTVDVVQCYAGDDDYSIVLTRAPTQQLVTDYDRYVKTTYMIVKAESSDAQAFVLDDLTPQSQTANTLKASNYDQRFYERDHDFV